MKLNMVRKTWFIPKDIIEKIEQKKPSHKKVSEFVRDILVIGLKNYK